MNNLPTLLINIFITISQFFEILDNDLIKDFIDGENIKKKSTIISAFSLILTTIIFIASNILTYYLFSKNNEPDHELNIP